MSRLSVVIFGATGYTGKHAALEMARLARKRPDLTWGVAGRSRDKLEDLMRDIAEKTGEDQSKVRIIIADVSDEASLEAMCAQTRVLANCCGPYRLYGEPAVRAAVRARAHHVDVTGEPQFMETMQLKYDAEAREAGVYVVSACGFDCVPTDMGTVYLQQNFGGTLNSVEAYLSAELPPHLNAQVRAHGAVNSGTWQSLVHGLANWSELKPLRQKLFPIRPPALRPRLLPRRIIHSRDGMWCVPFPGADNSVVFRSQHRAGAGAGAGGRRPAQFRAYVAVPALLQAVGLILAGVLLAVLSKFELTRNLLLKYPRFFTGGMITPEGLTEEVVQNSSFKVLLHGEGWAEGTDVSGPTNRTVVARVSGVNPGYGFTVAALLLCALTILDERDRMPQPGGVLTTAAAFGDTGLVERLNEHGARFEIISTGSK